MSTALLTLFYPSMMVNAADTTPPDTTITSGPSGNVTGNTATFSFSSNEANSRFECQLDPVDAAFSPCISPKTYSSLANGSYTFRVRVIDAAGNTDISPATRSFTVSTTQASWSCSGKDIYPGQDIDAIINNDPSGTATRFCVHAGTYQVSAVARLRAGDKLDAEPGTTNFVEKGGGSGTFVNTKATQPIPVVKLVGSGTDSLLRADGTGISITWVDLSGASGTGPGTGSAIAAGSAGSDFLVQYARIHNNDSLGISNMKGTVLDSEFFSNSEASASIGFNASAVKGITEYVAGRLFVHDEQGNGLWCDVGCEDDPARANGFWVYDSVVVNSGRAGIRYENSPNQALFENNEIHGNGVVERRGGIDIRDSQNALVRTNIFGPTTIAGVSYPANGDLIGVRATDSGRSDRVDLSNVDVLNNNMNSDSIVTCGGPIFCSGNTDVGSR